MPSFAISGFNDTSSRTGFDIGPKTRTAVWIVGTVLSVACVTAVLRAVTGLAPMHANFHNLAVALHVITVIPAVPLGAYLLLTRKGTDLHKLLGKIWVGLMVTTALAITFSRGGTDFSWIHIFVPYTIIGSWKVISTARQRDLVGHRKHLVGMYLGALAIPGVWAFSPERLMGLWLFG